MTDPLPIFKSEVTSVLAVILLLSLSFWTYGAEQRIQFKQGQTEAQVVVYLANVHDKKCYALYAKKGQHLNARISARVMLHYPSGNYAGGPGGVDDVLPETGNYHLCISPDTMSEDVSGKFPLQLKIE